MGLPTTSEAIEDEERRLGRVLPEVIKSLIVKNNGGAECMTESNKNEIWSLFSVKDTRTRKHISRSASHIERETESARNWSGFPKDAIALGENGCGDYLIMIGGTRPIYIWSHETGELTKVAIRPLP